MAVGTGYRKGKRAGKETAGSTDFGFAMEEVLSAGPEPDARAEIDGRRLMAQAPTADISADLEGAAGKIAGVLLGAPTGRRVEASCGCARYTCCEEGKALNRETARTHGTPAYGPAWEAFAAHREAAEAGMGAA